MLAIAQEIPAPSPALELRSAPGVTAGRLVFTLTGRSVWPVAGLHPSFPPSGLPLVLDVSSTAQWVRTCSPWRAAGRRTPPSASSHGRRTEE